MVLNDSMSEKSGIELQVRKGNNISWKINNKSLYRPNDPNKTYINVSDRAFYKLAILGT